jgi:hypothetical protein
MHGQSCHSRDAYEMLEFQQMAADRAVEQFPTDEDQQIAVMMHMDSWPASQKKNWMSEKRRIEMIRQLTESTSKKRKRDQKCIATQFPVQPNQGIFPFCHDSQKNSHFLCVVAPVTIAWADRHEAHKQIRQDGV